MIPAPRSVSVALTNGHTVKASMKEHYLLMVIITVAPATRHTSAQPIFCHNFKQNVGR